MSNKPVDVVVVGELNVDIILNKIEGFPAVGKEIIANTMHVTLGSSSAIFASNLSSLSANVAFIGRIGNDNFAKLVIDSLTRRHVETSHIVTSATSSTGATIVLTYDQDRANVTYPGAMNELCIDDIDFRFLSGARHLHFSSYFMQPGIRKDVTTLFRKARELGLTGANINLNRGNNLLWIEGPGRMTMPVSRSMLGQDLAERPSAAPAKQEMLEVQWQDGMSFDGEKARARFEGRVSAVSGQQRLETRVLEVAFRQPLRFNEVKAQTRPEAEKLLCSGGVSLESRTANDQGQPSLDRMSLGDLAVHLATGAITGSGPGWMSSVRRNTGKSPLQPPGSLGGAPGNPLAGNLGALARRPTGEEPSNKLVYVNVRFHESIRGNFRAREMSFHERVRVVYGPVQSWEEQLDGDRPDLLGPEAIVMDCDRLTLVDMPAPAPNQRAMELEAIGNTAVLGKTFTARGARMTYSEGKGLLVLEGDGRNDAELFRQELVGGPRAQTSARKILFWPRTEQVRVEGARSFESGALPQSKPR